mmetsp:Transcript_8523/g.23586  ORF Transcript_8523/g.23586 Transcript_8523/m.23586 type:complete len:92 (+) Transcript_8523:160-435(+)
MPPQQSLFGPRACSFVVVVARAWEENNGGTSTTADLSGDEYNTQPLSSDHDGENNSSLLRYYMRKLNFLSVINVVELAWRSLGILHRFGIY